LRGRGSADSDGGGEVYQVFVNDRQIN